LFAVGHFASGYIASKLAAKVVKTRLNIPLVLMLSVIPDVDLFIPFLEHRGPSHSIIVATAFFIPLFIVYHKSAIPYFAALIQHSLLGDYIAGQTQLLWPFTLQQYGMGLCIKSAANLTLEWMLFITAFTVMWKTKDMHPLFQPHNSNLILAIPTFTVLLPTFLAFPLDVPALLLPPHLIYLAIFLISFLIDVRKVVVDALGRCVWLR
jgi:membrane-bound metal-dependent hydrolase YbcI (DUF457 family)